MLEFTWGHTRGIYERNKTATDHISRPVVAKSGQNKNKMCKTAFLTGFLLENVQEKCPCLRQTGLVYLGY